MTVNDIKTKKSNILDISVKNYGECGFCSSIDNKEELKIPWAIWSQWIYISRVMGDKEWGAIFWVKDNTITSYKIPKQEVTSVECEFKEELGGDGIIHSHHDMGAFHSSQDDAHARNLYTYSIVTANSKGSIATKRVKLPCNGFGYVKVELKLIDLPQIDLSKITEKMKDFTPVESLLTSDSENPCESCTTGDCETCGLFSIPFTDCESCLTFKCKSCKVTYGFDTREILPFCELCNYSDDCASCEKIKKYLENYPEDRHLR